MPVDAGSSYDEVPYESQPFYQSHPRWLATVAKIFGLSAPPPETARILELGCASGGNLLPMAESLPQSHCLGIDLSARQIAEGQALLADTGLDNVELRHASILDLDSSYGQFDYIVCHGVYSWVPREIQQGILRSCRERLTPQGIAYVSYNTYPGWHMKGMLRDMMRFHSSRFREPGQRIAQSRALLEVLAKAVPARDNPYGMLLKQEAERLRQSADSYIYHEHLEENNDPCYFHEFARRSHEAGLQFLGESELRDMLTEQLSPEIRSVLRDVSTGLIYNEQYLDFFCNRTFRQTLLCRSEVMLERQLDVESFRSLCFASALEPLAKPEHLTQPDPLRFGAGDWPTATVSGAIGKVALLCLGDAWPRYRSPAELEREVRGYLGLGPPTEDTSIQFIEMLWNWFTQGVAWMSYTQPLVTADTRGTPRASAVARAQVRSGKRVVTNLLHRSVRLEGFDAILLECLDGTRDRSRIIERLSGMSGASVSAMSQPSEASKGGDDLSLDERVEVGLARLAHVALLVP